MIEGRSLEMRTCGPAGRELPPAVELESLLMRLLMSP